MLNYQQTMVTIIKVSALTRLWRAKCGESFEQRKNQCKLEARDSAQSRTRGEVNAGLRHEEFVRRPNRYEPNPLNCIFATMLGALNALRSKRPPPSPRLDMCTCVCDSV